jgi:hypothetical protein
MAIAIGAIAILMLLAFWLRLKNLEKRIYLSKKTFKPRLNRPKHKQQALVTTQIGLQTKTLIKPSKRNAHKRLPWLLAIAIASITGIAIALIQLGNGLISPEISTYIWFFIGVMLIVSASFIKVG